MKKTVKEVTALTRTYDLILWIVPVLAKFPKGQKYLLGDRIESLLLEVLELLIQAVYTKDKIDFLCLKTLFSGPIFSPIFGPLEPTPGKIPN